MYSQSHYHDVGFLLSIDYSNNSYMFYCSKQIEEKNK